MDGATSGFSGAEARWADRLENLRSVIRQELVARQVAPLVGPGTTVLDVGCGQGTQAVRLAGLGAEVTGVDPSPALLERLEENARNASVEVTARLGTLDDLSATIGPATFDLVCAHGLLMYLDRSSALDRLVERVRPGGRLSLLVRNGDALAFRPGLRGDWTGVLHAVGGDRYTNELGIDARADRRDDLTRELAARGVEVESWYGVRVFNDGIGPDVVPPDGEELAALLDAEDAAGRLDPYRSVAALLHLVGRRGVSPRTGTAGSHPC